jgi:hypothetical protein
MNPSSDLPNEAITGRLREIGKHERGLLVETLRHLAELERRNAILAMGYPSSFAFCSEFLGYSNGSAFRRTKAARLLARFPMVADYLADGRVTLSKLVELREVLDEANVVGLLDRAVGMTEDQVKALVAELRPKPALPDSLRLLPTPRNDESRSGLKFDFSAPAGPGAPARPIETSTQQAPSPPPQPRGAPTRVAPIAPQLHVLRATVSDGFVADLKKVRHALSHKIPGGRLEDVLHECIRVTLAKIEKRRRGAGKKSPAKAPLPGDPYVSAAVCGEVWDRDDGRCAFVGTTGRRCSSPYQVENHHADPSAKGGLSTAGNVRLFCRAHNALAAEQDFGRAHVAGKIAEARRRRRRRRGPSDPTLPGLG